MSTPTSSSHQQGKQKPSGIWILKSGAVLTLLLIAWISVGSGWYTEGRAQIFTANALQSRSPDLPCYHRPPPECLKPHSNPVEQSLACIDETYRGQHQWFNSDPLVH